MNPTKSLRRHTRKEASEYLWNAYGIRRSAQTLASYAVKGTGPAITYEGVKPTYAEPHLDEFATGLLSRPVHSTSERRLAA